MILEGSRSGCQAVFLLETKIGQLMPVLCLLLDQDPSASVLVVESPENSVHLASVGPGPDGDSE